MKIQEKISSIAQIYKIDPIKPSTIYYLKFFLLHILKLGFFARDNKFNLLYRLFPNGVDLQLLFNTFEIPLFSPQLTFAVRFYLVNDNSSSILEFGSGGSTIFFSNLGIQNLTSIETNPRYHGLVKTKLNSKVDYRYIEISGDFNFESFERNKDTYFLYSDNFVEYSNLALCASNYDFILIDGFDRKRVLLNSMINSSEDNIILFHDYSYREIFELYPRNNDILYTYYYFEENNSLNRLIYRGSRFTVFSRSLEKLSYFKKIYMEYPL